MGMLELNGILRVAQRLGRPTARSGIATLGRVEHGRAVRRDRIRGTRSVDVLPCKRLCRLPGLQIFIDPRRHFSSFGDGPDDE